MSRIREVAGRNVQLEVDPRLRRLPADVELAAFRIVQGALTNAIKYSGPALLKTSVNYKGNTLIIQVSDDGIGFDVAATLEQSARKSHIGLLSIRERAALLGGNATIKTSPGKGTQVTANLPLTQAKDSAPPAIGDSKRTRAR